MKKKTKQQTKTQLNQILDYPTNSHDSAKEAFLKNMSKTSTDASALEKVVSVLEFFMSSGAQHPFSETDVIYHTRVFEIPVEQVREILAKWVLHMSGLGKIAVMQSLYDDGKMIVPLL